LQTCRALKTTQPQNIRAEYWKRKTKETSSKFLQACRTLKTAQFDFMRNCAGAENMCKYKQKKNKQTELDVR
jgi:hypothetical protein